MQQRWTFSVCTLQALLLLIGLLIIAPAPAFAAGATQIAGLGAPAAPGECTDAAGAGADFSLSLAGDLEGCHYIFVETATCSPSGTYFERGTELFVGTYNGAAGTFGTTYQFSAKYEDCTNLIGEIFGRCQHPIAANTGTGVFEGVTGRLDFKDDVAAGNFPYRGHLRW